MYLLYLLSSKTRRPRSKASRKGIKNNKYNKLIINEIICICCIYCLQKRGIRALCVSALSGLCRIRPSAARHSAARGGTPEPSSRAPPATILQPTVSLPQDCLKIFTCHYQSSLVGSPEEFLAKCAGEVVALQLNDMCAVGCPGNGEG